MRSCAFVPFLLCLISSTFAFAEDIQLVPHGVVEGFIGPDKLEKKSESPVESAVDETPTIAQEAMPVLGVGEESVENSINTSVEELLTKPANNSQEEPEEECCSEIPSHLGSSAHKPEKKWHFAIKPGYFYFTDSDMRQFYDNGGFGFRVESGCKVWGPMLVWFDGSFFQKTGKAIGGTEKLEIKLATITLGLKGIYHFNSYVSVYAGAGPRLFMMMQHNDSPFVRGDDSEIGIGGGFDAGLWFFPIPQWKNFFFDLFADYSWKKMKVQVDEISSMDNDVDVSGVTAGLGIGLRF